MGNKRHALLIGINRYSGQLKKSLGRPLDGCVNDVQLLHRRLAERGFRPRILLDERATRQGITGAVEALIRDVGPGDEVVIHYSGHGSEVQAATAEGEDGWQRRFQTLVPHDSLRCNKSQVPVANKNAAANARSTVIGESPPWGGDHRCHRLRHLGLRRAHRRTPRTPSRPSR